MRLPPVTFKDSSWGGDVLREHVPIGCSLDLSPI